MECPVKASRLNLRVLGIYNMLAPLSLPEHIHNPFPYGFRARPAVAPGSMNWTVIERYITPSSETEFADLFSVDSKNSFLKDRICELTDDGVLVFMYPTKTGATTFTKSYLKPLIEPLLRQLVTTHTLPSDTAAAIDNGMNVLIPMPEFAQMATGIADLARELQTAGGGVLEVVYEDTDVVRLQKRDWIQWWSHQERANITAAFRKGLTTRLTTVRPGPSPVHSHQWRNSVDNFREVRLPERQQEHVSAEALTVQFIEDLNKRNYEGPDPTDGIEVAVFVLRRVPTKQ
ncbi:hypothetical protein EJ06DRAFT_522361 [Trichodelitschia bisporula]|uniref:Uncharacterized protein n=1 Tax=Trichodelitschia bisporula TaxID=703511 RepID=A0A6G1HU89_9PEZI|nr:hypothetical protein EJ06DRAFT_522361 [Trichodelitschia bisporula]